MLGNYSALTVLLELQTDGPKKKKGGGQARLPCHGGTSHTSGPMPDDFTFQLLPKRLAARPRCSSYFSNTRTSTCFYGLILRLSGEEEVSLLSVRRIKSSNRKLDLFYLG